MSVFKETFRACPYAAHPEKETNVTQAARWAWNAAIEEALKTVIENPGVDRIDLGARIRLLKEKQT